MLSCFRKFLKFSTSFISWRCQYIDSPFRGPGFKSQTPSRSVLSGLINSLKPQGSSRVLYKLFEVYSTVDVKKIHNYSFNNFNARYHSDFNDVMSFSHNQLFLIHSVTCTGHLIMFYQII